MPKFNYKWYLKDGYNLPKNNLNVFGTFICGGGSTMGYKLAGYNHLGGVEIDKKIADVYKLNHNPKYLFIEDLRIFNQRNDLPEELYNLDILDGSPPCSNFSMAGNREKDWGKKKHFKEGQAKQVLDDLVFVYCDTINKLKPKVAILENVKGIITGNAKLYSKEIVKRLNDFGYKVQVFLLNAASMGVPQKRERVFFIASKKESNYPDLKLEFNEKPILLKEFIKINQKPNLSEYRTTIWNQCKIGQHNKDITNNGYCFIKCSPNEVANTLTAKGDTLQDWTVPRYFDVDEWSLIATYPLDYNFNNIEPKYLIGMSVPPVMMAQISYQIYLQWFANDNSIEIK
ncbi:MAG TPA: DNA (cytosine-5-)-methyltransferase [Candidatus Kapabacteria bacterium]|nr:DNA (cytosine-5-)-methyltransferase [Candidatus Kapabacteria bacterium]